MLDEHCSGSSMQLPLRRTRSSNSSRRHSSLPFSSMLASGMILAACRIAESRPYSMRVVQVDAVEHLPGVRVQPEAEQFDSPTCVSAPGRFLLDEPDAFERLDGRSRASAPGPVETGNTSGSNSRSRRRDAVLVARTMS